MRAYWELSKAGFRRYSRYRTSMISSIFTNSIFGLLRASFLLSALHQAGDSFNGYDPVTLATYVWLGQAVLGPLDVWGSAVTIGERVKSGDIAVDFTRPVSVLGSSLATTFGRAAFELIPRGAPPLIIGALVTPIALPHSPAVWVVALASMAIAVAMNHIFFFMLALTALWFVENRGWSMLGMVLQNLFSGFLVPVWLFPGWMKTAALLTPFPSMLQTPVDILSQRATGAQILPLFAVQLGWLVALVALCLGVLSLGRRKVVIQGG